MHVLYMMIFSVGQTLLWLPRNPTLSRAQSKLKNNLETPQPLSKRTLLSFCQEDLLVVYSTRTWIMFCGQVKLFLAW